ncbi:hypothetical protein M419DRAFT_67446 [Trichoderma reesei RUT C-30]|uniref:FAR1 domain-containing protein n=1 Tax=Hypocrea jecorina (strain ATCC 56765 / BCRC 32924 / NRRL 11460 / Rut C-30) TaxID=1344414 RepID=A0A024SM98_HYPJR|nr:hypothetical protein M419DRAFT_67446 [Trichoderma reesei RUT C-30]
MPLQPPPTDKRFASAEEAFKALQAHARDQGYAVVKTRPSDYKDGKPRRYDIACVCGNGKYKSGAAGLRKSGTKRTGCPFKMKIVRRKDADDLWVPGILCGSHNHDANSAINFPEHRRGALTVEQTNVLRALLGHSKLTIKTIGEIIKLQFPDILLTEKDISNLRQAFNRMSNASSSRTVDGPNQ